MRRRARSVVRLAAPSGVHRISGHVRRAFALVLEKRPAQPLGPRISALLVVRGRIPQRPDRRREGGCDAPTPAPARALLGGREG